MLDFERVQPDEFLENFPKGQMFRFFVDARKQSQGWKAFENNEPGYLNGMFYSLNYELMHLDEPLSTDVILRVHANALHGVRETNYQSNGEERYDVFRSGKNGATFGLHLGKNMSKAGYQELVQFSNSNVFNGVFNVSKTTIGRNKDVKTYRSECVADDPAAEAEKMVELYHSKLEAIDRKKLSEHEAINEKMDALIDVICQLERLHPFSDANCRTFCMNILYRECLKMGVMPPLLDDPNQFDGFSRQELKQKIFEGGKRAREIIDKGEIETHYRIGLFASSSLGGDPTLPEQHKDLTQIDKLKLIEIPYKKWSETPERLDEDGLVYRMIVKESIDRLEGEINQSAFQMSSEELSEYEKEVNSFVVNLCHNDAQAKEQFKEAINFGCTHQIKSVLSKVQASDMKKEDQVQLYLEGLSQAHRSGRKEIQSSLMDSLTDHLTANMGSNLFLNTVASVYKIDNELGEKILFNAVIAAQDKGMTIPAPVLDTARVIFAQSQHDIHIRAKLQELEGRSSILSVGIRQGIRNKSRISSLKSDLATYRNFKKGIIHDYLNGNHSQIMKKVSGIPKISDSQKTGLKFGEHLNNAYMILEPKEKQSLKPMDKKP